MNRRGTKNFGKSRNSRKSRRAQARNTGVGLSQMTYKEVIRMATYNISFNQEKEWPVVIRFGAIASANERMIALCTVFQQYKVSSVRVTVVPLIKQGNYPPPLYMVTGTDREISPLANTVIQTGRRFQNNRASTVTVNISGRQNDFGYWFDCEKVGTPDRRPTIQWSFAADTYQLTIEGQYQISIAVEVSFRFPQYDNPSISNRLTNRGTVREQEQEEKKVQPEVSTAESESTSQEWRV